MAWYNGTSGNDRISGSNSADVIAGHGGNDWLRGLGGNDQIHGGDGKDTIYGDGGNDWITGRWNDDLIYGGEGNDTVYGGASGNNTIYGNAGSDYLVGHWGNDVIYGGDGVFSPNDGADTIKGSYGRDLIYGNGGNDSISAEGDNDTVYGGQGNDTISGGRGRDFLWGGNEAADRFVFSSKFDTDTRIDRWDVIADFNPGQGDRIDLRDIDAKTRSGFSGDQAFSFGVANAEGYIWTERVGNDLLIKGNIVDGYRATVDFVIELDNYAGSVSASHFFL